MIGLNRQAQGGSFLVSKPQFAILIHHLEVPNCDLKCDNFKFQIGTASFIKRRPHAFVTIIQPKGDPMSKVISVVNVEQKIFYIRSQKVMLDRHLAELYGVPTGRLNEQVKRNLKRFPSDFMFQLDDREKEMMVSQNAIPSRRSLGGTNPYVFTEQGIAMLSSVLNSDRAIAVNIAIMRAFVKLREILSTHKELTSQLKELERKVGAHDHQIAAIFDAIQKLMAPPPEKPRRPIGFVVDRE